MMSISGGSQTRRAWAARTMALLGGSLALAACGGDAAPALRDAFIASSTPSCVVANWECIRATSYIYPNTPISNAQAQAFAAQGFEIGVEPD